MTGVHSARPHGSMPHVFSLASRRAGLDPQLIRSGSESLKPALRAMRAASAAVWREAVGEAIRARQPQALTDVLDAAPVDWATAELSSQNLAFHGIFDALLPLQDGHVTAELARRLLKHLPSGLAGHLLLVLDDAPAFLRELWPHLTEADRTDPHRLRDWFSNSTQNTLLVTWMDLVEAPGPHLDRLVTWILAKPVRASRPGWPVLISRWIPEPTDLPGRVILSLQKAGQDGPLELAVARLRALGLRLTADDALALREAWQAGDEATAAGLIALLPPEATLTELIRWLAQGGPASPVEASLMQAQGRPDPHGHLTHLAHGAGDLTPEWQAMRRTLERQAQLERVSHSPATARRRA